MSTNYYCFIVVNDVLELHYVHFHFVEYHLMLWLKFRSFVTELSVSVYECSITLKATYIMKNTEFKLLQYGGNFN